MRRLLFRLSLSALVWPMVCAPASAQTISLDDSLGSDLLPAGRHALRAELRMGRADSRYNSDAKEEPMFAAFNNVPVAALGIPSAQVTQFKSVVSGERLRFTYGYGFGDDLTGGIVFGWYRLRNKVDFSLTPGLATTETVQSLFTNPLYRFKPLGDSYTESPLDTNLGLRWRVAKGEDWSLVLSPVLRLGTSKQDDPDDLLNVMLDDGSTDFQMAAEYYRQWREGWETRASLQYTHPFKDHYTARAFAVGETPLQMFYSRREQMDRQLGDAVALSLDVARRLGPWRISSALEYAYNGAADFRSPTGQDVSGLENGTSGWTLKGWLGASWNGIGAYLADRSGLPVIVTVYYETVIRASNAVKTENLHLTVTMPF